MPRPVDLLIDFLEKQEAHGATHTHLDEDAREGLRQLYERTRLGKTPPLSITKNTQQAKVPPVALPLKVSHDTKAEQLAFLQQQIRESRALTALGTLRETMVFSTGSPEAKLMLIGEAPGYQEEKAREPFVGPAGQKLNDIIKAMGLHRNELYISNIVKYRPAMPKQTTNNRKPTSVEIAASIDFVRAEISIVKPTCIVALGETAAEGLLGLSATLGSMRGTWHVVENIPVRVTYHPSYLLQSSATSHAKRLLWEDMLAVMEKLEIPVSDKQRSYFLPKE